MDTNLVVENELLKQRVNKLEEKLKEEKPEKIKEYAKRAYLKKKEKLKKENEEIDI